MKLFSFIVGAILFFSSTFAQVHSGKYAISGRVIDFKNGKILKNINVYIAHSLKGASTDNNGNFLIPDLESGNYKIIVSSIGYHTIAADVKVSNSSIINLLFKLETKIYELPTVSVLDKDADEWRNNLRIFTEQFIGQKKNAEETNIEDSYVLEFKTNEKGELTASAQKPLVIFNYALGYKITYFLNNFITNGITTQYSGLPVFEELKTTKNSEKQKWDINREETYLTSFRYFLKSICDNYHKPWIKLLDKGFTVTCQNELRSDLPPMTVITPKYLKPAEIETEMYLTFPDYWKIAYKYPEHKSEFEFLTYQSWIKLHADSVYIDQKGRYYDRFKIQTFGEWASHRIADMLPYEYDLIDIDEK